MSGSLPGVAVLGNCVHLSLAQTLRRAGLFSQVVSYELYSMDSAKRPAVADSLAQFDYVLTIEHSEKFGELATAALKLRYGDKVISLPTPFFSGWQPDMAYLTYGGDVFSADNILGDYHSALILAECKAGLSEDEVVERYVSGNAFERMNPKKLWNDSLAELKLRERNTEISLSDYIEEHSQEGQMFLSFNHPKETLVAHIARCFARYAFDASLDVKPLAPEQHDLYKDVYWPVHPVIADINSLPRAANDKYKSPLRLGEKTLSREEFARLSFHEFAINKDLTSFDLLTPSYLKDNLSVNDCQ